MSKSASSRKASNATVSMAEQADRHMLYEASVQEPEAEMDFVEETFRELRDRDPVTLREDFCGTGNSSCEWVRRDPQHTAVGVDIDTEVLDWGRENHLPRLAPEVRERVQLIEGDVLTTQTEPVDVVLGMNFSYYLFRNREALREYFEVARKNLVEDGILFLDAFGGYEGFREMEEATEYDDFTYVWDQDSYDPITGHMTCRIHFRFPDGSRLDNAFVYEWRMWTLPEIQELLREAGFSEVTVYWEGTDEETGEGDGEFFPAERGEADAGWIAYIVAEK